MILNSGTIINLSHLLFITKNKTLLNFSQDNNMNPNRSTPAEWSRILIKQDQQAHNQDTEEHLYRQHIKNLYKKQLQSQIEQHRRKSSNQKQQDKKLVEYACKINEAKMNQQKEKKNYLHKLQEQFTEENINNLQNKRRKQRIDTEVMHRFYNHKYERISTEIESENRQKIRKIQNDRKQLSSAYNHQIGEHDHRKQIQKYEDERIMKLMKEIEDKKQKQRQRYFNKIRGGYHQNPEVYENVKKVMRNKQQNRSQFLDRMSNLNNANQIERMKTLQQNQKIKKVKEVSNFNLKYNEEKKYRERHQSLEQTAQYHQRFEELQERLKRQRYQKQMSQIQSRNKLKEQLQHQISDLDMKRQNANKLNDRQYSLNKSEGVPALPGLWKDHTKIKQHQIIENFLRGKSTYQ